MLSLDAALPQLPDLLTLLSHPSAHRLVPDAIARILAVPHGSRTNERSWHQFIDGAGAKMRRDIGRVLQQPESTLQPATDGGRSGSGIDLTSESQEFDEDALTRLMPAIHIISLDRTEIL